jgi:hypothetical protein
MGALGWVMLAAGAVLAVAARQVTQFLSLYRSGSVLNMTAQLRPGTPSPNRKVVRTIGMILVVAGAAVLLATG